MATNFGSLGDLFPDQDIHCRVRGCPNLWQLSGSEAMHNLASGGSPRPDRMCEQCYQRFLTLHDQALPCDNAGCAKTWTWNRFQQLEAWAQGRQDRPRGMCETCRQKVRELQDQEIACRMKGCTNTWTWRRQAQLHQQGKPPRPRFCQSCADQLTKLADQEIACRMKGCHNTWMWNRYQQLEYLLAGHDVAVPPSRMCPQCFELFQNLADRDLPCMVDECKNTWRYTIFAQIEHGLRRGAGADGGDAGAEGDPADPRKMCPECWRFYRNNPDRQIRCVNRGCEHTWTYTRSMQLHHWHAGIKQPPGQMCDACQQRLAASSDRQCACAVPDCTETWTYSALDQLKDHCLGREPLARRCPSCEQFLAQQPSELLTCKTCAGQIAWSAYEQLLCAKGSFVRPEICAACAQKSLQRDQKTIIRPLDHHLVVRMPAGGKWGSEPRIAEWPPHLDYHAIENAEKADLRIVAFGDDLTWSAESAAESWPALLEENLNKHSDRFGRVAVINAGIPGCTSRQALLRLQRDVVPFAPHVVIFSFAFADACLHRRAGRQDWRAELDPEKADQAMAELCRQLGKLDTHALYWIGNPILPHDDAEPGFERWAGEQLHTHSRCLVTAQHHCHASGIAALDLKARFEINGEKTARKWMTNWYNHNATGARNIAIWMAEYLLHSGVLPEK